MFKQPTLKQPALKQLLLGSLCVSGLLTAMPAMAHQAYIIALGDMPEGKQVLLHAGYTEALFVPEFPLEASYSSLSPDGQKQGLQPLTGAKSATLLELPLPQPGTYKVVATKQSKTNYAQQNGQWKAVYDMAADKAPAASERPYLINSEVKATDQQQVSTLHGHVLTYVSKEKTSSTVLAPTGEGLEFKLAQHPNQLTQQQGLTLQVLFNGKPISGVGLHLERAGAPHAHDENAEDKPDFVSNQDGQVIIPFAQAGQYLLHATYPNQKTGAQPVSDRYQSALSL
ncbi:MAG: DUF4198 domain-containing protein [Moraxellaceae bacterium]|nr:MAG: DUF4198 domain-containing protein [Moraxellaceae bacterium]